MVGVEERGYWVSGIGYQVLGKWGWEMGLMG